MRAPERAEHGSTRLPQPDAKSDPPDRADDEDGREDPAKRQNGGHRRAPIAMWPMATARRIREDMFFMSGPDTPDWLALQGASVHKRTGNPVPSAARGGHGRPRDARRRVATRPFSDLGDRIRSNVPHSRLDSRWRAFVASSVVDVRPGGRLHRLLHAASS